MLRFLVAKFYKVINLSGGQSYRILPLHSQIPREDQHKVFVPAAQGVTKVRIDYYVLAVLHS